MDSGSFNVDDGTSSTIDVTLAGLTLTGGDAADGDGVIPAESGGAVLSRENLTIIQSTISGNAAGNGDRGSSDGSTGGLGGNGTSGGSGGGIRSYGTLALFRSTVSGNLAGRGGGGGYGAADGGNGSHGGSGGGVFSSGTMTVFSSTISGNRAGGGGTGGDTGTYGGEGSGGDGGDGGGIFSSGTLTVTSSTVSGNRAGNAGFGGYFYDESNLGIPYGAYGEYGAGGGIGSTGSLTLTNSIVAGNRSIIEASDLKADSAQTLNASFSLIGDNDGSGLNEAQTADAQGNLIGSPGLRVDPLLGPLADNGGPTLTHALLPGSPAINSGFTTEPADQRGFSLLNTANLDMGSFERQAIESTTLFVTSNFGGRPNFGLSLRKAIEIANQSPGADTIKFSSLFDAEQTIQLLGTEREMEITDTLSIEGPGQELLTIDGGQGGERIFNFSATTGDLTISGLRLTGGQTTGNNVNAADHTFDGGGIRFLSSGVLTLTNSTVEGNSTSGDIARGGGIFTQGSLVLNNSTVSGNSTADRFAHGGGIYTAAGSVTLNQSTVSNNSTFGNGADGGGIHTRGSDLLISSSTVSGNTTTSNNADGGGIYTRAAVTLVNSTISNNHTTGSNADGGGIAATGDRHHYAKHHHRQ